MPLYLTYYNRGFITIHFIRRDNYCLHNNFAQIVINRVCSLRTSVAVQCTVPTSAKYLLRCYNVLKQINESIGRC